MVTWGHTLQFASTSDYDFFHNPVFILIYSFHMPLFMAVSGYLFFQSQAKRSLRQLLESKWKQILLPTLLWAVPMLLVGQWRLFVEQPGAHITIFSPRIYIDAVTGALWFLWDSFIAAVLTAIIAKRKDKILVYGIVLAVVLLLPNWLSFYHVKYMLPYFFAGYLYHREQARLQLAKTILSYLCLLTFPLLLLKWNNNAYIYVSGHEFYFTSLHAILTIMYRYVTAGAGVIVFITATKHLFLPLATRATPRLTRLVAWLGQQSMGIYLVGGLLTHLVIRDWHISHASTLYYSLILTPAISLATAGISGLVTHLMSRVPLLNQYLLGGRVSSPTVAAASPRIKQAA